MFKKLTILALLLLIIAKLSYAQTYPVTASTQIIPPYSTYLADYVAPGTNRLALNIFLGDVNRPELRVKLKLSIIGQGIRIETKPGYLPPALILQGGVPERLIASDLAEYFRPENLNFQGITRQQFQRTGQLPEGLYQFCFEVLEYNRSVKISNSACAIAWLILNDPPVVNIPRNGEKLRPQDPQYVTFQWTPRHTGSPNSAFATEYEFSMVEIWPDSRNPNDAILTSPPIYQTTTQSTTLIYGPAETPLVPGRHYAFRVRAKSISGIDELDLFKNQGYSQTYSFIYGDACTLPNNISAEVINSVKFKVKWQSNFNHTNFTVRYREANANSQWYQEESFFDDKEIRGLKEATKYEYQVMAGCGPFTSEFSPIAYATTDSPPEIEYSCGLPPEEFNIGNTQPLPTLNNGDIIYAGDFDIRVTEATGSAGTFAGKGTVKVPYLDNLIVSVNFSGISINTDYRMTSGSMNVEGIGVDVLPDNVTDFIDKLDETLASVDDILSDVSNGLDLSDKILDAVGDLANEILDNGPFSDSTELAIQDFTPAQYLAEAKKKVTEAVEEAINGGLSNVAENKKVAKKVAQALALTKRANKLKDIYANSDTIKVQAVEFYANASGTSDGKYGFDISKYPQHRLHYNIMVLPDNTTVPVPWAASNAGEQAQIKAKWLPNSGVPADSIIFKSGADGETLSAGRSGNEWTVMLPQIYKGQSLVVNAVNSASNNIVGKLNAFGYETLPRKVHIVPVGTSRANFTKEELTSYLNEVYAQALATWDVTLEAAIQVPDFSGTLQDDKQALLSTYSDGMRAIIKGYKASATIIDNEFYLFLVDKSQTGKSGYMPRKHQFGFIYMGESGDTKRTIAHELGHGAFRLQHTWEEYPGIAQGTSNNLMDYGTGTQLRKYQWDLIHNPPIVIGLVEDLDEGAYTWGFFGKKYAHLFNHIYENNKASNLKYLNKIGEATNEDKISLLYSEDESRGWDDDIKSFIDSWDIGTYSGNEIANSILNKIKNAGNNEKIETINLNKNRIYIGKYGIDNRDYPMAIYAFKESLSNLSKIVVDNAEKLTNTENIKSIYCDETYTKYLIIAFYENEEEPSLIIQIEKFIGDDTKEKWLKYLGILSLPIKIDYNLKLYDGDNEVSESNIFMINSLPEMPDIRASVESQEEKLKLRLKIEYFADKIYNGQQLQVREDVTWYPDDGWKDVSSGEIWDIDFGTTFRGGTGYLIFKKDANAIDTLIFYIRGTNPSEQEVHNYTNTLLNSDGWYVPKMIRQESNFRQFNTGTASSTNNSAGMPNWGPPYGWGMKQLDNIGSPYGYLTSFNNRFGPYPDELWSWQANVRKGIEFFNGDKLRVANSRWNNALDRLEAWEAANPDFEQNTYSMVIIDSPNVTEENTTVTEIVAGNATNSETFVANENPAEGQRSIRDAFACKYYNGGADYFNIIIPVSTNNTGENPPDLPYWEIDKNGSTGRDYVDDISGRAGW